MSYLRPEEDGEDAEDFAAMADFTDETAERHPEWKIDMCDDVVAEWNGAGEDLADMTLVWGVPMVSGATIATAVLAGEVVDGCVLEAEPVHPARAGRDRRVARGRRGRRSRAPSSLARLLYDPSTTEKRTRV